MNLADYPNQYVLFLINSCTKLMAYERVWWIKQWWINENSLYTTRKQCSRVPSYFCEQTSDQQNISSQLTPTYV